MDTHALQLASRFSYSPNHLGYCGRHTAHAAFTKCIRQGSCASVAEEISHFIVLYPYLKTIAQATDLTPCDYRVIEAYWMGNDLLSRIPVKYYDTLIEEFTHQGVPDTLTQDLRNRRPRTFIPSHLFQVLHVGVGQASGAVPFTIESVNECAVRWGVVKERDGNGSVRVNLCTFEHTRDTISVVERGSTASFHTHACDTVSVGDTVAVHWGGVVKVLDGEELSQLRYWSSVTLDALPLPPIPEVQESAQSLDMRGTRGGSRRSGSRSARGRQE